MHTTIIIPARFNSSRLPGKLMKTLNGKTILEWVYNACKQVPGKVDVIIATDSEVIKNEVEKFNGSVIITSSEHSSGTSRCIEVAKKLDSEIIINVQGDEPFIDPAHIITMINQFQKNQKIDILTLFTAIENEKEVKNPNNVKLVKTLENKILYFSRARIPYNRENTKSKYYKHIGIYGFKKSILVQLENIEQSALEQAEKLEQLAWMENGFQIFGLEISGTTISIDTQEDLDQARDYVAGLSK